MHFVCSLYASLTAYIFSLSALRTRLFSFLYALYAVFFGVVSSHSVHSRFFDAYNAYKFFLIVHPGNEADGTDGLRTRPQERMMIVGQEIGWDGGGRPIGRAMKARKTYCPRQQAVKSHSWFVEECLKTRAVEDRRTSSIRRSRRRIPLLLFYMLVCILYAPCMHPRLHTFSCPQPYGHAYSRFCMHCMQSFSELCSRIACIVGFLMHTMHTSRFGLHPFALRTDSAACRRCDAPSTHTGRYEHSFGKPVLRLRRS